MRREGFGNYKFAGDLAGIKAISPPYPASGRKAGVGLVIFRSELRQSQELHR